MHNFAGSFSYSAGLSAPRQATNLTSCAEFSDLIQFFALGAIAVFATVVLISF